MEIIIEFSDVTAVFTDQLPTQLKFNIYHIKEELVSLFPADGKYQYPGLSLGFRIALLANNHNNLLQHEIKKLSIKKRPIKASLSKISLPKTILGKSAKNKRLIPQNF